MTEEKLTEKLKSEWSDALRKEIDTVDTVTALRPLEHRLRKFREKIDYIACLADDAQTYIRTQNRYTESNFVKPTVYILQLDTDPKRFSLIDEKTGIPALTKKYYLGKRLVEGREETRWFYCEDCTVCLRRTMSAKPLYVIVDYKKKGEENNDGN